MATAYDVQAALQSDLNASALLDVADYGTGEPLAEGQWQLQGGLDGVVETTTAELAALFSLGEEDAYVTVTGSGDSMELVQVGEVVLTGGGANYTVESTLDSVVSLLNSTPAVTERLTASGSGTTVLQALPSTPLSGGVARASVVTAAALVALFQSVSSVAEAMTAAVMGDPTALVQPAELFLSGGQDPASVSTVNELVGLLNGTPEVAELIQTTGSGETVVTAGSVSLSGGGEQVNPTGTRTYGWDVHGRLAQVSLPNGQVHSYSYDYRTRRIGLQQTAAGAEPAQSTAVVFSGGLSLAEYESQAIQTTIASPSQSTVRYVRGPDMGGGVGGLLYSRRAQAVKFNLSNGRGDIVAQSDASGTLTWTASYEAYGKRTLELGSNADRQRANTKEEDPTGLLNEGFRYRDIETGVWLSRDPAGFVDGPNLYAYVKQNPWTAWDPHGLCCYALPPQYAQSAEFREGFHKGMAQGFVAGVAITVGVAATVYTGGAAAPVIAKLGMGATATMLTTAAVSGAAGGAAGGAASQMTSNALTGQPVLENVPQAAGTGAVFNMGGAVLGQTAQAFSLGMREGTALATVRELAKDAAATGAPGGAANVMVTADGQIFTGLSKNAGGGPISDAVKNLYGSARTTCAEARALTAMETAGASPQGAVSASASVNIPNLVPGTPMQACNQACAPVLKNLGIGDAVAGTLPKLPTPTTAVPVVPKSETSEDED